MVNGTGSSPLIFGAIVIIALIPTFWAYYRSWREHAFMKKMARSLQFDYQKVGAMESVSSQMLAGGRGKIYDVISGSYKGMPTRAFTYCVYIHEGKHSHWSYMTVFETQSTAIVPNIVLRPLQEGPVTGLILNGASSDAFGKISMDALMGSYEAVPLEGDFNTYFKLFAAKGSHIEALELFAPDTMAKFIDEYRSFGVEFAGNKLYVYPMKLLKNEQAFLKSLDLVEHMYNQVLPTLTAMATANPDQ